MSRSCKLLLSAAVSPRRARRASALLLAMLMAGPMSMPLAQEFDLDSMEIPVSERQLCFGMLGITDRDALAVCDALALEENVKARELAQDWVSRQPDSPAAHFALAEVLTRVEGNLPRAVFHLGRAEALTNYESMGRAMADGNLEWHYLTLAELATTHQLMGNQEQALAYLDKLREIYGQDTESYRGWPLIKLKQYDEARASAERVLATSNNPGDRSRAWNTLCAVELADLRPSESLAACERAMSEEEDFSLETAGRVDTVHLLNASEVSLNLLQMDQAERYLQRAVEYINPNSVGNPWIYMLYLTLSQSRFEEARAALDNMLVWYHAQTPMVSVMNQAEHFLASAMFLLLNGYPEDAARLTAAALNQPDRTGSYSADEAQKDSIAALINAMANKAAYEIRREQIATQSFIDSLPTRFEAWVFRFKAWRSGRHAASLFADRETLQNRLRPYAPLDVHIPEWVEPELVRLMGPGVVSAILESARDQGVFALNEGYYYAYRTEIAALAGRPEEVITLGEQALQLLPDREGMPRGRVAARIAAAAMSLDRHDDALQHFSQAMEWDPSIIRRLGMALPVRFAGEPAASEIEEYLARSPRIERDDNGFLLEAAQTRLCLNQRNGAPLVCHELESVEDPASSDAAELVRQFHHAAFGLGYTLTQSQRLALLGNSVILSGRNNPLLQERQEAVTR